MTDSEEEEEDVGEYVLGIDVSVWQDNNSTAQQMDFTKSVAMGAKFVFIKSSQALYADQDILYNWKSAKAAGLLRGAYHFLDWNADSRQQAQYAWSLIKNDPGELPPVVDFEYWNPPPPNADGILLDYLIEMKRLSGKTPIIYTGAFFWNTHGTESSLWKEYPLWIASYTTQAYMETNVQNLTPWDTWTFWQYTSSGDGLAFGAESLNLDMNYYNGSYEDLCRRFGVNAPVPPPVEPPVEPPPVAQPCTWEPKTSIYSINVREAPTTRSRIWFQLPINYKVDLGETVKISDSEEWRQLKVWVAYKYGGKPFFK